MLRSYVADPMDLVEGLGGPGGQGRSYHPPYRTQLTAGLVADFRELVLLIERANRFPVSARPWKAFSTRWRRPFTGITGSVAREGGFRR